MILVTRIKQFLSHIFNFEIIFAVSHKSHNCLETLLQKYSLEKNTQYNDLFQLSLANLSSSADKIRSYLVGVVL